MMTVRNPNDSGGDDTAEADDDADADDADDDDDERKNGDDATLEQITQTPILHQLP